jgi:hypothetical protein
MAGMAEVGWRWRTLQNSLPAIHGIGLGDGHVEADFHAKKPYSNPIPKAASPTTAHETQDHL